MDTPPVDSEIKSTVINPHSAKVMWNLALSPDGTTIAAQSTLSPILLFSYPFDVAAEPRQLNVSGEAADEVSSMCFLPDSTLVTSVAATRNVARWNIETGKQMWCSRLDCHATSLAAMANGHVVVAGRHDGLISLLDVANGGHVVQELEGHRRAVVALAITDDDRNMASGSHDKSMRIWDLASRSVVRRISFSGVPMCIALCHSPTTGRTMIATGLTTSVIHIYDLATGSEITYLTGHHRNTVASLAFSPDGAFLVSGSWGLFCVSSNRQFVLLFIPYAQTTVYGFGMLNSGKRLQQCQAMQPVYLQFPFFPTEALLLLRGITRFAAGIQAVASHTISLFFLSLSCPLLICDIAIVGVLWAARVCVLHPV